MIVDTFSQTNPAFAALSIRWLCEGYEEVTSNINGVTANQENYISPLWAIVGVSLISPDAIRNQLPQSSNKRLRKLMQENDVWTASLIQGIQMWRTPFWLAVRYGVGKGIISVEHGRLRKMGRLKSPSDIFPREIRRKSKTLGKLFAQERDDSTLAILFGIRTINR